MNIDLLSAGLRMTVLGMGMVYVFLIVMIIAMKGYPQNSAKIRRICRI